MYWSVTSSGPQEGSLQTKLVEMMESQLSYFKSWKMMLLKCCTPYASKFGKLNSGHKTGKGEFSFQSQRKAMPMNAQIITQLHSFHMPARLCSKSFKPGFINVWTKNLQMYKLNLEKTQEPDRGQTANNFWIIGKTREFQKNIKFCFTD